MTICYPLLACDWLQNEWPKMTLSGYFMSKSVFGHFLTHSVWLSRIIAWKVINIDPYYQRQECRSMSLISSNKNVSIDIRRRFWQERLQTWVGSFKSTYWQLSRCYIFVSFATHRSWFLPSLMTLSARFNLKCALRTARLTYVCCGFWSWPCVFECTWALTVSDKNVANELYFHSIWGLYEFSPGFTAEEATNRSWAAKHDYSHCASLSLRYLEMCGHFAQLCNRCGVQWSARSLNEPRKTCVADALYLCVSRASCSYYSHNGRLINNRTYLNHIQ